MKNIYKVTLNSHGRIIEMIVQAKSAKDALSDISQANKNAYSFLTNHKEIDTEGEIVKVEKLSQIFGGLKATYYS
ncbi:MAG: hypothetical protein Q7R56_00445 [Nanoarchaeota archaeon]|nr:hypothetical protein [Nanoarchaeota archaeon]